MEVQTDQNIGAMNPSIRAAKRVREDINFQGCPPEMVEALSMQLGKVTIAVANTLSNYKPIGQEAKPWASEWKSDRLWIAAPLTGIQVDSSIIDQIILYTIQKFPTRLTITAGAGAEDLPHLSIEDERFLTGILSAISGDEAPRTLKCGGSSIVDLTFYACWNLAAASLVNNKELRGSLHPAVLPDKPVAGGKASAYLADRFKALKATLGINYSYIADTLERVVKLWVQGSAERTRQTLLSIKIPWSLVLSKGGEFTIKEKKQGRVKSITRLLRTPINPKNSAWLMPNDRKPMAHLCAPVWGEMDKLQKEWNSFSAEQTHSYFDSFIDRLRGLYKRMHQVSDSMLKKLGFRKAIILNHPAIRKMSKNDLKKANPNSLVLTFSKQDLSKLSQKAKAVFDPLYVASDLEACEQLNSSLDKTDYLSVFGKDYSEHLKTLSGHHRVLFAWTKKYFDTFKPEVRPTASDIPKDALAVANMFGVLSEEDNEQHEMEDR